MCAPLCRPGGCMGSAPIGHWNGVRPSDLPAILITLTTLPPLEIEQLADCE